MQTNYTQNNQQPSQNASNVPQSQNQLEWLRRKHHHQLTLSSHRNYQTLTSDTIRDPCKPDSH